MRKQGYKKSILVYRQKDYKTINIRIRIEFGITEDSEMEISNLFFVALVSDRLSLH